MYHAMMAAGCYSTTLVHCWLDSNLRAPKVVGGEYISAEHRLSSQCKTGGFTEYEATIGNDQIISMAWFGYDVSPRSF
jgi:hypothetical protein